MVEASVIIEVPFYDVDPMSVVWHGNYVKYLEDGREAFGNQFQLPMVSPPRSFPWVFVLVKFW